MILPHLKKKKNPEPDPTVPPDAVAPEGQPSNVPKRPDTAEELSEGSISSRKSIKDEDVAVAPKKWRPFKEIPVPYKPNAKYVIYEYGTDDLPENQKTKIHKFCVISFYEFFGIQQENPQKLLELWKSREEGWDKNNIPQSPMDNGCLRLMVWKGYLPNPEILMREVEKRWTGLERYPQIRKWIIENARGCMPNALTESIGNGWCRLCGSNFFGMPLKQHRHQECPFKEMSTSEINQFIAINTLANCPHCSSRSGFHFKCNNGRPCSQCGEQGHQVYQKLCHSEFRSPDVEKAKTQTSKRTYLQKVKELHEEGKLSFYVPGDATSKFYTQESIRRDRDVIGTNVYLDRAKEFKYKDQMTKYLQKYKYRGLVNIEADAAWSNDCPIFYPSELDTVEELADSLDILSFGKIPENRKGTGEIMVLPSHVGLRMKIRKEREEAQLEYQRQSTAVQKLIESSGTGNYNVQEWAQETERYFLPNQSLDGWETEEVPPLQLKNPKPNQSLDGWEMDDKIPPPQERAAIPDDSTSQKPIETTEAKESQSSNSKKSESCDKKPDTNQDPSVKSTSSSNTEKLKDAENSQQQLSMPSKSCPTFQQEIPNADMSASTPILKTLQDTPVNHGPSGSSQNQETITRGHSGPPIHNFQIPSSPIESKFFLSFSTDKSMTIEQEMKLEAGISKSRVTHQRFKQDGDRTRQYLLLVDISKESVGWTIEAGRERVTTLLTVLTGEQPSMTQVTTQIPVGVIRAYAWYLQAVIQLASHAVGNSKPLKFVVSDCEEEIVGNNMGHHLFFPSIRIFETMGVEFWKEVAEKNWSVHLEWLLNHNCTQ